MRLTFLTFALMAIGVLASATASADQATKASKLHDLMKLQGMEEMIQEQISAFDTRFADLKRQSWGATVKELSGCSQNCLNQAKELHDRILDSFRPNWTPSEIVDKWMEIYGGKLTEADVDEVLAYTRSPIGKKDVAATKASVGEWTDFWLEKTRVDVEAARTALGLELRRIIEQDRFERLRENSEQET